MRSRSTHLRHEQYEVNLHNLVEKGITCRLIDFQDCSKLSQRWIPTVGSARAMYFVTLGLKLLFSSLPRILLLSMGVALEM